MRVQKPTPVVVDTETTGFGHFAKPPREDAVVQIGLAYRSRDGQIETWSEYCNPGEAYLRTGWADRALEVNHLTRDRILTSRPVAAIAKEFHSKLAGIESERGVEIQLRAFNRDFDLPFLASRPWSVPISRWGPCIMLAVTEFLDGPDARWVGLDAAMRRLGLDWPERPRHDAAVDSHAALLVLEAITNRTNRRAV